MRRILFVLTLILATTLTSAWLHRPAPPAERQHLGAADMRYSREKTPGVLRVLVIGDSFVWGAELDEDKRFADVLDAGSERLEVVTLALFGANTPMMLDAWKEYGRDVNADIVILAISYDDNTLGLIEVPDKKKPNWIIPPYFHAPTWARWGEILTDFRADIENTGAQAWAFVMVQPYFDSENTIARVSRATERHAAAAGFRAFNFLPVYRDYYGDLRNPPERRAAPYDNHYNAETHRVLAAWLWGLLEGELSESH